MRMRVRVGFAYYDGRTFTPYERTFTKQSLDAFHSGSHWNYGVRMLILIQGEKS
jgi:hypothetical protein